MRSLPNLSGNIFVIPTNSTNLSEGMSCPTDVLYHVASFSQKSVSKCDNKTDFVKEIYSLAGPLDLPGPLREDLSQVVPDSRR